MRAVLAWGRRRPTAAAAAIYALLAVALLGQAFLPGRVLSSSDYLWTSAPWQAERPSGVKDFGSNGELADSVSQVQPFLQYTRRELPDIPLWNPYVMGGRPYLANAQSAIFSPFNLPAYVLPFWHSLALVAALKLFVAAFGAFLLGRALGMRFGGALLTGLVYGFGLFFVAWLSWPLPNVWAWIPWVLLLTEHAVRRPGPLPAAGLAAVVALQFLGGHPESSFHALFAALAFFVLRMSRRGRPLKEPLLTFAGGMIGGAALAAITLVPFFELLFSSSDVANRREADPSTVQPRFLITLLVPEYYGRPTSTGLVASLLVDRAFYVGALTLLLAAVALVVRPTRERVAVAAFGAFSLAMVIGLEPLFSAVRLFPGFELAHNTRMTILFALAAALLAGWGLDELSGRLPKRRRLRAVIAGGCVVLVALVAWVFVGGRAGPGDLGDALEVAWGFASPPGRLDPDLDAVVILAGVVVTLTFAGAAILLLALRARGAIAGGAFAALAFGLLVADLFRAGMGQNPAVPIDHVRQPATGAVRFLREEWPARFAGAAQERGVAPLVPNVSMRYGVLDARGYDYPIVRRYDRLWQRTVRRPGGFFVHTIDTPVNPRSLRTLGLLGVRYVLQQPADRPLRVPGLELVYGRPDARIYLNRRALPRAFVVDGQRVVGSEAEALAAVAAPGFDARLAAVTERRLPGIPERPGTRRAAGVAREEPDRITLRASAPRDALLVLADVYYPGWKAFVDGSEVPVERVDYLLRGVRLPAGSHTVELRYEPLSFRLGWITSCLALLVLSGTVAAGLRRRR